MKVYAASTLNTGVAGSLNYIDVTSLSVGDAAIVFTNSTYYVYKLQTSSAAENVPSIITPVRPVSPTTRWFLVASNDVLDISAYLSNSNPAMNGSVTSGTSTNVSRSDHVHPVDSSRQPLDATLTALAGVTTAANKVIYATALDTFATCDLTAFGRSIIAVADLAAAKTLLEIGTGGGGGLTQSTLNTTVSVGATNGSNTVTVTAAALLFLSINVAATGSYDVSIYDGTTSGTLLYQAVGVTNNWTDTGVFYAVPANTTLTVFMTNNNSDNATFSATVTIKIAYLS